MENSLFIIIAIIVIFVLIFFHYVPFFLWINALSAEFIWSLVQLFLMRLRRVPPHTIVYALIEAHKAVLKTSRATISKRIIWPEVMSKKVVHALVSASKANIDLSFQMATAIDLAGRDVLQAVQMSVNPK
jgi:uncharacterized protein YqfA (UPF0365 family)